MKTSKLISIAIANLSLAYGQMILANQAEQAADLFLQIEALKELRSQFYGIEDAEDAPAIANAFAQILAHTA